MTHPAELDWPFFEDPHRKFKSRLDTWCQQHLAHPHHDESRDAVDAECIRLVRLLGAGGWIGAAGAAPVAGDADFPAENPSQTLAAQPERQRRQTFTTEKQYKTETRQKNHSQRWARSEERSR